MAKRKEKAFLENGSVLLEEMISSCNGKCNPIKSFTSMEILRATDNFHQRCVLQQGNYFTLYKGSSMEYGQLLIKKYSLLRKDGSCPEAFRDIVIGSQMSSHNNVLKLIGCCLEFQPPIAVFEYPENGPLNFQSPLPWKTRLKIAKEIANAVLYLHTALPRAIVHRSLAVQSVFLGKHNVAKLSNFSVSITIPEGKTSVVDEDPYMERLQPLSEESGNGYTGSFTEQNDVFGIGWFMVILLTGQTSIKHLDVDGFEDGLLNIKADPKLLKEVGIRSPNQDIPRQLDAFMKLALRCTLYKTGDRPSMIDVAKELRKM